MSISEAELVKNGKLTSFYLKLVDNVNRKLDNKIDNVSHKLLTDFEKKKKELLSTKKELEDLYKMQTSISEVNKFYNYRKTETKRDIKSIHPVNGPTNPSITTKNLLDTLDNIEVKIDNGDYTQLVQRASKPTIATPSLLLANSDKQLSAFTRFSIIKKSNVVKINEKQSGFETAQTSIVMRFKKHRVNPEHINIRYLTLPNEPKQLFSYITNVLGSNDGTKWEPIGNINVGLIKNFDKATLFKFPVGVKTPNFYEYLCFQSQPSKEAIPNEHIPKLANRPTIPICNFEIFGNYYANEVVGTDNNIVEDFQDFFDTYVNTTYSNASNKTEIEYLVKMMLEAYKELTTILTECKIQNAMKTYSTSSVNTETETELEPEEEPEAEVEAEAEVEVEQVEEDQKGDLGYLLEYNVGSEKKEETESDMLMTSVKNPYSDKKIKIFDTESNSIVLGESRNKQQKKKKAAK
jgi:hypothetical protein